MAERDYKRRIEKTSTVPGEKPTIPGSNDHTDGSWAVTDIYKGELFINVVDGTMFTRDDSGIIEILGKSINKSALWNNGAISFNKDENYVNSVITQSSVINITLDSNDNGSFSSYFVRIATNGDKINFPGDWVGIRDDYTNAEKVGNFGLYIFYDGVEYQYQIYEIVAAELPPLVAGIISEYLFSNNYSDTVGGFDLNTTVNTSFVADRKTEVDSAVSLVAASELKRNSISIGFTNKFSISMWVYLPASPSVEIGLWDFNKLIANDFIACFMTATGEPRIQVSQNVSGFTNKRYLSDLQMVSGWNHIVFVVNDQSILGWLNNTAMTFTKLLDDVIVYNDMEGSELVLDGRYQGTDYRGTHYKDDVRISNTAWDASDVAALYNE